ncbi:neuropeptide CCHamide-1 [Anopheles funestus]|uniref:neuropeptide CCHamide-1 n=1 Tax=Anopheles funestus TaxID=62324 RepID=UPI0020C73D70|nr:neuropeptide CCHamide-1 [Anopheles funestus]XP_049301440.1 neuropeptide CCHamide-1 [Anopheles funestus]XP_049301441.1 neuropeptide CCHamide-1 [Anopheles funestus]XP_049301442.1 neuropeptide CCHamide-1 [Anopheles funestus]
MHQLSTICFTLVIVSVLIHSTNGKRGCAAFGHACYGGHGKRSGSSAASLYPEGLDPSMVALEVLPIPYSKLALDKSRSLDLASEVMRPNSPYAIDATASNHRTDTRTGELKYAIYAMLRQLMEESAVNRQEQSHQQQQVQSLNQPFPHDAANVGDIERK